MSKCNNFRHKTAHLLHLRGSVLTFVQFCRMFPAIMVRFHGTTSTSPTPMRCSPGSVPRWLTDPVIAPKHASVRSRSMVLCEVCPTRVVLILDSSRSLQGRRPNRCTNNRYRSAAYRSIRQYIQVLLTLSDSDSNGCSDSLRPGYY